MSQPDALREVRFSVLCVKTVNDLQSNTDVVEVACVRIHNLQITETLHLQLNPGTHLPEEFTRKTGIYTQQLREKPSLETVLPDLAAFMERDVIIWVNPPGKTNAVHRYFKLTQPRERQLCLNHLAQKTVPDLPRYGIVPLSQHLKLAPEGLERIETATIIAAKIFLALLGKLEKDAGITHFSQLMNFCPTVPVRTRRTRNDLAFDREKLKHYPTQPGVYFMKNRTGEILYVGKAKNLRNRLRSYFQKQSRLPSKIATMMRQVTRIDVTVVGSELEALLLESRLIKQILPFFNKKIKDFHQLVFLKVSVSEPFPTVSIASDTADPDAAYFGPFKGVYALKDSLDVLNRVFQLRDCSEKKFNDHREAPCMQYQLGFCSGPCAGLMDAPAYRERVSDFLRYLQQQPCNRVEELIAKRDAYGEALMFEKAAVLQERLNQLENLQLASYRLWQAVERHHCLLVLPHSDSRALRLLSVLQGQPHEWKTFYPDQDCWDDLALWVQQELDALARQDSGVKPPITKDLFEEARLISQWLAKPEQPYGLVIPYPSQTASRIIHTLRLSLTAEPQPTFEDAEQDEAWEWESSLNA